MHLQTIGASSIDWSCFHAAGIQNEAHDACGNGESTRSNAPRRGSMWAPEHELQQARRIFDFLGLVGDMEINAAGEVICPYCETDFQVELTEFWGAREFSIGACCSDVYEAVIDAVNSGPRPAAALMRILDGEQLRGHEIRGVIDDGVQLLLDFKLKIRPVRFKDAKLFIQRHHAHHSHAPCGWRYGASVWNGGDMVGVLMAGRPVGRMLDQQRTVEVNRLAVRRDIDSRLAFNACSKLYGWAAREAEKRGFEKIITYVLETEDGASLKAAGWERERITKGGSWNCPSRPRTDRAPTGPKTRWCRHLRPRNAASASRAVDAQNQVFARASCRSDGLCL